MQKCAVAGVIIPKKCLTLQPKHTRAMTIIQRTTKSVWAIGKKTP